jgi:hypothetical protein
VSSTFEYVDVSGDKLTKIILNNSASLFEDEVDEEDYSKLHQLAKGFPPKIFYIKGANGYGKSTVPLMMTETDPDYYHIHSKMSDKILFTVFPNYKMIGVGPYTKGKNFGGGDSLTQEDLVVAFGHMYENTEFAGCSFYLEGSIISSTKETYFEFLRRKTEREAYIVFIEVEWDVLKERIMTRTNKTEEEFEALGHVKDKVNRMAIAKKYYVERLNEIGRGSVEIVSIDNNIGDKISYFLRFLKRKFVIL